MEPNLEIQEREENPPKSTDPHYILSGAREIGVDDGAGTANRRSAVAVGDWKSAAGRGRRNPERNRRSKVGTPVKHT